MGDPLPPPRVRGREREACGSQSGVILHPQRTPGNIWSFSLSQLSGDVGGATGVQWVGRGCCSILCDAQDGFPATEVNLNPSVDHTECAKPERCSGGHPGSGGGPPPQLRAAAVFPVAHEDFCEDSDRRGLSTAKDARKAQV